jgi:hypothetical protein
VECGDPAVARPHEAAATAAAAGLDDALLAQDRQRLAHRSVRDTQLHGELVLRG